VGKVSSRLRIGEKIGLSFGFVGLLFLAVIWQYHQSLTLVLESYDHLHRVFEARKTHAFAIESHLADARQAENAFLMHRSEEDAAAVDVRARALLNQAAILSSIDDASRKTAERISELVETYLDRFHAIAEAWRIKGLDHNSGLQGAFRDTVHELEHRAGNFKAGRLYLQLLQIRRGEKDLGLRREALYRDKVRRLVGEFRGLVKSSELYPEVKEALLTETEVYADAFEVYAKTVLSGGDLEGGKGPFRSSAHRLEAILEAHYVPDLETNILQLRRREKDYLLRGDHTYVNMVGEIAGIVRRQIGTSEIATQDKAQLTGLLDTYQRDFLALVAQNDRIDNLASAMHEAADRITPLVKTNVEDADRLAAEKLEETAKTSRQKARLNLLIVVCAVLLGVFFALSITARIVRPVREMAGLLERLTHESPSERIATVPGARDEINAMAESLNTMADHRSTFVGWWKASMDEALALRDLHEAPTEGLRGEAAEELRLAALAKVQQLNKISGQLRQQAERIGEIRARVKTSVHAGRSDDAAAALDDAALTIKTLLEVIDRDDRVQARA
jgi:methyl-accepting chemotaxis protein